MDPIKQYLLAMDAVEEVSVPLLSALLESGLDRVLGALPTLPPSGVLPDSFFRSLITELRKLWATSIRTSSEITLQQLESKADIPALLLEEYIELYGRRSATRIAANLEQSVRQLILTEQARGRSVEEIARTLSEQVPQLSASRAAVIARTETHAASQFASQRTAERSPYLLRKRWNSVLDDRVRDFGASGRVSQFNHRVMDNQRVSLDGSFLVPMLGGGFEALAFPGDPNGSPGNIINCRCVQTYVRRA